MEACLLCLEIKELLDSIKINSDKWQELNIRKLIEKHLWPIDYMESYSWLCKECWEELHNFNKFYQRIVEAHIDFGKLMKTDEINQFLEHKLILKNESYKEPEIYLEPEMLIDQYPQQRLIMPEEKFVIKEELSQDSDADSVMVQKQPSRKRKQQELSMEDPLEKTTKRKINKIRTVKLKTKKMKSIKNLNTLNETLKKEETEQPNIKQDPDLFINNQEPSVALEYSTKDNNENNYDNLENCLDPEYNHEPHKVGFEFTKENNSQKKSHYKPRTNRKQQDKLIAKTFKEMVCDLCQFPMVDFSVVHKHFNEKHNAPKGYVMCCSRKFFSRTRLVDHIDYHKNPDKFKCKKCGRELADSIRLKLHMMHVHEEGGEIIKRHSCDVCGKSFVLPFELRSHKMSHLSQEEKKFPCAECGKFYASTSKLNYHIQAVHLKKFVKICHICGKSTSSTTEYNAHIEKHEGKPAPNISCDICGLRLTSQGSLKRHKEAQHPEGGKKDHCCPKCPKVSPTLRALKKHIQTMHEKGHEHKCTLCEKAFKRAEALKEHMASHTGTSLYTCSWCPKTFNSNGNMHSHRKKMHPIEWEEAQLKKYSGSLPPQYRKSVANDDSNF